MPSDDGTDLEACWFCGANQSNAGNPARVAMWGNDRFDRSGGKVRRSWDQIEVPIPRCPRCRGIHEVVYKVRLAGVLGLTAVLLGGLVVLLAFQKGLLSGLMLLAFFWYFFYYKAVAWIFGYIFAPVFWLPCRLVVPWKVKFSSHGKKHPLVKARIEQGWRPGSPSLRFFPTFQKLAGGDVR